MLQGAHAEVLPAARPHTVQGSHGTSVKPAVPSLCPCPAELTPYTPHSSDQTIICPASPSSPPSPLCPSPGCAGSRQGAKGLSCPCLAPGCCWAPALPSPAWAQLEEATSTFWSFPSGWVGVFSVCLLEICVDSCLSLTSPCVTWGSPLGAAPRSMQSYLHYSTTHNCT